MEIVCKIIITQEFTGLVNVSAPMKYKELCYNILDDAATVIKYAEPKVFTQPINQMRTIIITMNMSGLVDVQAPLPNREMCYLLLQGARTVIEQFDEKGVKTKFGYADCM